MSASPTADTPKTPNEVRIISHSTLFYWWPVWFFGYIFALWTLIEDSRMIVVPRGTTIKSEKAGDERQYLLEYSKTASEDSRTFQEFEEDAETSTLRPKLRITRQPGMAPLYFLILMIVIFITNIPLRGLWSVVVIILLVMVALIFTLLGWWDDIFRSLGNLHVYINLGGYVFMSTMLFIIWFAAVNFFDKRTYVIFTRGQVRVCEEIGGREKTYDTIGMTIEKHRDDLFRHWVLGGGSGDLTIRTSGTDSHQISMPNVLWIGWRLPAIENLMRMVPVIRGGDSA